MTDLLHAEDIKKAVGAFTGEQRAPLRIPLPSSISLAPAPPWVPGLASLLALLCSRLPRGASGAWRKVHGTTQTWPRRDLAQAAGRRPGALPDTRNSRAPKAG